jgi:hemerythrin-like domain-containing protein
MALTQTLREEHQIILAVLDCLETALNAAPRPDRSAFETFGPFVDFLREFADECHHQKEEGYLFPMLERAGLPHDGGPIGCMLEEHGQGRAYVKAIAAAIEAADSGDAGARRGLVTAGEAYIELLRNHINKENNVLFAMADEMIVDDDAETLAGQFNALESDLEYRELAKKGRAIADRLMAEYAVAFAS